VLKDIELRCRYASRVSLVFGGLTVYLAHRFFGVNLVLGAIAIPLVFVFTVDRRELHGLDVDYAHGRAWEDHAVDYGVWLPEISQRT